MVSSFLALYAISIHTPRVGSDFEDGQGSLLPDISIHTPRVGSDSKHFKSLLTGRHRFQSTLPVWGATIYRLLPIKLLLFQSTLPVWGATNNDLYWYHQD